MIIATFKSDVKLTDARDLAEKLGITLSFKMVGNSMRVCLYKL